MRKDLGFQGIEVTGKVTLFVMTEKGLEFLNSVSEKYGSLIGLVVVGRDRATANDFEVEIVDLCKVNKFPFVRRAEFRAVETEYAIAVAWRWLIDHPAERLIVFHDSILPKYRGFAPLVNSLINGEHEIGVTAVLGADDFDTGAIVAQSRSTIRYPVRVSEAIRQNMSNYAACGKLVFEALIEGKEVCGEKQDEEMASYSLWRDEDDYSIDWSRSASEIVRFIHAVGYPYKGAATFLDGERVRVIDAEESGDVKIENRDCGKVLFVREGKPVVVCGRGLVKVTDALIEKNGASRSFFPIPRFRMRFTRLRRSETDG